MIVAISASVHPAIASRVTAVPLRSLNVTPTIPAAALVSKPANRCLGIEIHLLTSLFAHKASDKHRCVGIEICLLTSCFAHQASYEVIGAEV